MKGKAILRPSLILLSLVVVLSAAGTSFASQCQDGEIARWKREAADVTIIRDDWGIAHVYGKTDADAVFGAEYAQAEDDFNRVETNYINAMGRLAEAEGEGKIYQDLRMKLFVNPAELKKDYKASPLWLKKLMDGFADGLNFYLYKHPDVKPRVITHFEPWMALSFTEGSIGGDIERINLNDLQAFYDSRGHGVASAQRISQPTAQRTSQPTVELQPDEEPRGSNGAAISPSNTAAHHALL